MHRTVPLSKELSSPNNNSTEVENLCLLSIGPPLTGKVKLSTSCRNRQLLAFLPYLPLSVITGHSTASLSPPAHHSCAFHGLMIGLFHWHLKAHPNQENIAIVSLGINWCRYFSKIKCAYKWSIQFTNSSGSSKTSAIPVPAPQLRPSEWCHFPAAAEAKFYLSYTPVQNQGPESGPFSWLLQ